MVPLCSFHVLARKEVMTRILPELEFQLIPMTHLHSGAELVGVDHPISARRSHVNMKSILFGLSVLIGLPCLCAELPSAWAGDFGNAQRTYVPNSLIQRRYDTEPVGQTNWDGNNNINTAGAQNGGTPANSGSLSAAAVVSALDNASNQSNLSIAFGKGKKTLEKLIEKGK